VLNTRWDIVLKQGFALFVRLKVSPTDSMLSVGLVYSDLSLQKIIVPSQFKE